MLIDDGLHLATVVTRHRFSLSQGDSLGEAPSPSIKHFWEEGLMDWPGLIAHIAIQELDFTSSEPEIAEPTGA